MSTYHHGDLRAAVLGAAAAIIEKEGLAGLSVREAARRAGVSHNAPYRHFPDREALLAALAAEGFSQLSKALENRVGRELGEDYVRFALERPQRFRLMFGGQLAFDKHPELRTQAQASFGKLEKAFAGLGAEANFAAAAAWSLVHGLAHLLLDGHFAQARTGNTEGFVREVIGAVRFAVARRPVNPEDSPSAGP
jgi:AcrR family transcriptional regulator